MAKPRKRGGTRGRPSVAQKSDPVMPSDTAVQDEVDEFHSRKEILPLDPARDDDSQDSVDEDVEGVYDLPDASEEESEEDDDAAEDSYDADDGRLEELERQARLLRNRAQPEEESSSDEENAEDGGEDRWGARKRAYYGDSEVLEEDALKEEAEEALRLQRKAAEGFEAADFGIDGEEAEGSDDDDAPSGAEIEQVEPGRALEPAAEADAPELEALLDSLKTSLTELRTRIGPLTKEVRGGQLATAEGVSYLETKNLLLLHYCLNLLFYLLLKTEGRPVRDHPVIARLVEIRLYLERLRPLDKKLHSQIEKLLSSQRLVQAAQGGDELHPAMLRPNPAALVSEEAGEGEGDAQKTGVYRPPKLNPVAMDEDVDKDRRRQEKRAERNRARKSLRTDLVRDLAREVHEMPEEVRGGDAREEGVQTAVQRARLERRAAEEEELMARVPLSKKELKGLRAARRSDQAGGALLDDFADDVAGLVQASSAAAGNLSQRYGADLTAERGRAAPHSGDADLPVKSSLADRRARLDNARVKQTLDEEEAWMLADGHGKPKRGRHERNDDYEAVEQAAASRKKARAVSFAPAPLHPPRAEEAAEGHRKTSRAVEKNRGLTPHRRRDTKNPRVKGRKKFDKATVRRKGQVAAAKSPAGPYGGEATGIKSKVSKSRRL